VALSSRRLSVSTPGITFSETDESQHDNSKCAYKNGCRHADEYAFDMDEYEQQSFQQGARVQIELD
jgi:hypothetical protein